MFCKASPSATLFSTSGSRLFDSAHHATTNYSFEEAFHPRRLYARFHHSLCFYRSYGYIGLKVLGPEFFYTHSHQREFTPHIPLTEQLAMSGRLTDLVYL